MIPIRDGLQMPTGDQRIVDRNGAITQLFRFLLEGIFANVGGTSGLINQASLNLTAAGTTQATALALTADYNEVLTTPSGSGVILAALSAGQAQVVFNGGAHALNVYPLAGSQIDALGANAPYSLAAGKTQTFTQYGSGQVRSYQPG